MKTLERSVDTPGHMQKRFNFSGRVGGKSNFVRHDWHRGSARDGWFGLSVEYYGFLRQ